MQDLKQEPGVALCGLSFDGALLLKHASKRERHSCDNRKGLPHRIILTGESQRLGTRYAEGTSRDLKGPSSSPSPSGRSETGIGSAFGNRTVAPSPISPKTPRAIMAMP